MQQSIEHKERFQEITDLAATTAVKIHNKIINSAMKSALEKVMSIKQEGTLINYCDEFKFLFKQVKNSEGISECYGIYLFIDGLETEIRDVFIDWHQYSYNTVEEMISLALKIDANKLQDSFSPFDPKSSFYIKDLVFDFRKSLDEIIECNESFKDGKIQEISNEDWIFGKSVYKVFDEMPERISDEIVQISDKSESGNIISEIHENVIAHQEKTDQYSSDKKDSKEEVYERGSLNKDLSTQELFDDNDVLRENGNANRNDLLQIGENSGMKGNVVETFEIPNNFENEVQETLNDQLNGLKDTWGSENDILNQGITRSSDTAVDNEDEPYQKKISKAPIQVDLFDYEMMCEVSQIVENKVSHSVVNRIHRIALKDIIEDKESRMIKTKKTSQLGSESELIVGRTFEWKLGWHSYLSRKMRMLQHEYNEYVVENSIAVRYSELEFLKHKISRREIVETPTDIAYATTKSWLASLFDFSCEQVAEEVLRNMFDISMEKLHDFFSEYGKKTGHIDVYGDFYASLRSSYNCFFKDLANQCKQLVQQNLDSVTRPYSQVRYGTDFLFGSGPNLTFSHQTSCFWISDQENIPPTNNNNNSKKKAMAHMWHKWKSKLLVHEKCGSPVNCQWSFQIPLNQELVQPLEGH